MTILFIHRRFHKLPVLRVRVERRKARAAKAARGMARAGYPAWAIQKILGLSARRLADSLSSSLLPSLWSAAERRAFRENA